MRQLRLCAPFCVLSPQLHNPRQLHKAREQLSRTRSEHKVHDAELLQLRKDLSDARRELAGKDARIDAAEKRLEEASEERNGLVGMFTGRGTSGEGSVSSAVVLELTAAHNAERKQWMEQVNTLQRENARLQALLEQQRQARNPVRVCVYVCVYVCVRWVIGAMHLRSTTSTRFRHLLCARKVRTSRWRTIAC